MKPPMREVTSVADFEGPRGATLHALTLTCGHWVVYRKLPRKMEVPCVGCFVEAYQTTITAEVAATITREQVEQALKAGAAERKLAERTLKRSPRR